MQLRSRLPRSIEKRRAVYGGTGSHMNAKKLAEKLRNRCHESLGAYDGSKDDLRDRESYIRVSVFFSGHEPGWYGFTIEERRVRRRWTSDRTEAILEWEAEITVSPQLDVFVVRKTGDIPEGILDCALAPLDEPGFFA